MNGMEIQLYKFLEIKLYNYHIQIKEAKILKELEIYSEKLGAMVKISEELSESDNQVIMEDSCSSMVGWSHGGWNNSGGGANW